MSELLSEFFQEKGVKVKFLHSDIVSLERMELLRSLRLGDFDVLIGINLLREGLDLPEVALVAMLDADREGFLRSTRSLIQTFGRAARNVDGRVILYADKMTRSMQEAISETERRREIQLAYNKKHNITPQSIKKDISDVLHSIYEQDYVTPEIDQEEAELPLAQLDKEIKKLNKQMIAHAKKFEFEEAAKLRDKIIRLEKRNVGA